MRVIDDDSCFPQPQEWLSRVAPPRSVTVAFYDTTRGVDAGPRAHRF